MLYKDVQERATNTNICLRKDIVKEVRLKLRKEIATLIMEAEMKNKHSEKWRLSKEI